MAESNTTLYAAQIGSAGNSPGLTYPLAKLAQGKLRIAHVEYTVTGSEAANDTINLVRLKVGAVIVPSLSVLILANPGTALVIDIGDATTADRYSDALTVSAGGRFLWTAGTADNDYTAFTITAGNEVVIATIKTAGTLTGSTAALFLVAYLDE